MVRRQIARTGLQGRRAVFVRQLILALPALDRSDELGPVWRQLARRRPAPRIARAGQVCTGILATGQGQPFVKPIRLSACSRAGSQRIQPGDVGQQQPGIEPPPPGHFLPAIEHRLFHAVQCPVGQHGFYMVQRLHQRRIPRPGEQRVAPPRLIGRFRGHVQFRAGQPHIAVPRQHLRKLGPPFRGELRRVGQCATADGPLRKPLHRRSVARQADVPVRRDPSPPGRMALVHVLRLVRAMSSRAVRLGFGNQP